MNNLETIETLGENESLRRTISRLKPSEFALVGPGDDAAVVVSDGSFVVTTDTLVEGQDFRLDWSTGFDLGWKAVASNFSDIAAMGAKPTVLVVALVAPKTTLVSWLEDFADGLLAACEKLAPGTSVVGGDLASGEQMVIAVTAHGTLESRKPVLRSGAKVGDTVAVGGTLGRAACGLSLLETEKPELVRAYDEFVNIQKRPEPPLALGPIAADAGATSMLDISDGLAKDATRIAKASGVSINLDRQQLQGFEATLELAALALGVQSFEWVIAGGEDHGLLATFPKEAVIPRAFKAIGEVVSQEDSLLLLDGAPHKDSGWDSVKAVNK